MSIDYLIAIAAAAALLFLIRFDLAYRRWKIERRRRRRMGYIGIPIHDEEWSP